MLNMTCIACNNTFQVKFSASKNHNQLCASCQKLQTISDTHETIEQLNEQKTSLFPGIKVLKEQTIIAESAFVRAKAKYQTLISLYERLDREQAYMKLKLDLLTAKKTTKPSKKRRKSKNTTKAKEQALSALANLDPATRALVLAQMKKENQ